ncbi:VWA domain-containing protein [Veillonella sp.]|uniref:VWA domain-containing protein n=1 Tax=Veillonella sp. TaxID=1926307 RepID=UPI00257F948A|nr:VWA domain-containing protein [Veillonella sp.]
MDTSVQEALKIGLVNDQIHSVVISGGTGVGKSFLVRQCLEKWHIPYRLIPVYIDNSQLQETIEFEASLQQGQMVMNAGLLDDPHTRCWLLDDGQVLSPEVRHALLVEAKRRHILLIMTINHEDRTLTDAEWELVDVHVAMERASLESRVAVLQQIRDEISCIETVLPLTEADASDIVVSLIDNKRISSIATPDAMMSLAVSYALKAHTVGHGAEYVLLQVMKSLALLEGGSYCKPRHAELAALYVLPHRMKKAEIPESQPSPGENSSSTSEQDCTQSNDTSDSMDSDVSNDCEQDDSNRDELYPNESNPNESNANDADDTDIDSAEGDDANSSEINGSSNSSESKDQLRDNATNDMGDIYDKLSSLCLPDTVARIANQLFQWKLESSKTVDRQYRKGSGRRLMTKTKDTRGRMIRSYQDEKALEDLALVDTLRAAAPYQRLRAATKMEQEKLSIQSQQLEHQDGKELSIVIKPQDYRRKAREKRIGAYQLFVVDASGSMAARHRMEATKAAILSLLRDSYIHRDSVGLIAFRKESAEVLLPFTRSVERAERLLASMPTGGKTPLAHALRMAYTMCDRLLRAHRAERIQIICITDGRATSGDSEDPVAESKQWARILGTL